MLPSIKGCLLDIKINSRCHICTGALVCFWNYSLLEALHILPHEYRLLTAIITLPHIFEDIQNYVFPTTDLPDKLVWT
jgi:hypothetical protein